MQSLIAGQYHLGKYATILLCPYLERKLKAVDFGATFIIKL